MQIPNESIPDVFTTAKLVYEQAYTLTEGARLITAQHGLAENTAKDYINNYRYMMTGKKFSRTMNAFAMNYFLDKIFTEGSRKDLSNALEALQEHIIAYENGRLNQTRMRKMRELLDIYSKRNREEDDESHDEDEQEKIEIEARKSMSRKDMVDFVNNVTPADAEYVTFNGRRFKRDNKTVSLIKILRGFTCQICQTTIRKKNGQFYIEAAHIKPKRDQGRETPDNILILCPNHHKEFDHGDTTIVSRNDTAVTFKMNGIKHRIKLDFAR